LSAYLHTIPFLCWTSKAWKLWKPTFKVCWCDSARESNSGLLSTFQLVKADTLTRRTLNYLSHMPDILWSGTKEWHGGFGYEKWNVEECVGLCWQFWIKGWRMMKNIWFKKDDEKLITYESGGSKTAIDYILIGKEEKVKNVKAIPGEEVMGAQTWQNCDSPTSYRPVSLTSCISKLLKHLVLNRLCYYLESKNLITPTQAGFRPGRFTFYQVLL